MKIAIASTGNTPNAQISMFFARCEYFACYDSDEGKLVFIENNYRRKKEHAGIVVANFLVSLGIKKIFSGEFGTSIRSVTDPNGIQLIVVDNSQRTVGEIVDTFKKNDPVRK